MHEPSVSAGTIKIWRVFNACVRKLPFVLIFAALISTAAFVVLRHLPPSYSATSVVWLGSRETAILASPSAWSTVGKVTGSVEDGRTIAAVLTSVPVLRRVAISLALYDHPEQLRSRFSTFIESLTDSVFAPEDMGTAAMASEPGNIQLSALRAEDGGGGQSLVELAPTSANDGIIGEFVSPATELEANIRWAVSAVADQLEVEIDPRSEIAVITFSAPDPELAAMVVNEIPKAFAAERRERTQAGSTGAARWLAERVEEVRREVAKTEREIDRVRTEHGISPSTDTGDEQQLAALAEDVETARGRLREAYTQLDRGRAEIVNNTVSTKLFGSEVMKQLLSLRADAIGQRREYLTRVSENHALVREIDTKIEGLDKDIEAEKRRLLGDFDADVAAAQATVDHAVQRLEEERSKVQSVVERKAEASAAVSALLRDLEADKQLYQSLVARLQEARQVAQVENDGVSIIQPALPPETSSIIGRPLLVALAGSLSLAFGFTTVAGIALFDRRIMHPDELRGLGLTALVSAPYVPRGKRGSNRAAFLFQEAIRRLFAMTLYGRSSTDNKRTVIIASSSKREGKTTVARALATCASATGTSTVLVEGDLRKPGRIAASERRGNPGIVAVLEGRARLDDVLIVDPKGGPDVVPTTEPVQHSTELLASKQMRMLLAELRERYDFVVIDTPPVCLTPDAELLAPFADASVFVVRFRNSTMDRTQRALDLLADASLPRPVAFANMTDNRFFEETYGQGALHSSMRAIPSARASRPKPRLFGWRQAERVTSDHRSLTFTKTDFAKELHS